MKSKIKYGKEKSYVKRHRVKSITEYGLHTPDLTQEITNTLLDQTGIKFMDNSWRNDEVDSLWDEKNGKLIMTIYLPNSIVEDEDRALFNTFTVYVGEEEELVLHTDSIKEVVKYINENKDKLWGV